MKDSDRWRDNAELNALLKETAVFWRSMADAEEKEAVARKTNREAGIKALINETLCTDPPATAAARYEAETSRLEDHAALLRVRIAHAEEGRVAILNTEGVEGEGTDRGALGTSELPVRLVGLARAAGRLESISWPSAIRETPSP